MFKCEQIEECLGISEQYIAIKLKSHLRVDSSKVNIQFK